MKLTIEFANESDAEYFTVYAARAKRLRATAGPGCMSVDLTLARATVKPDTGPQPEAKHTPWTILAGTIIQDANGKTLFSACEESEQRGGDFDSIRDSLKTAVHAVNSHDALLAALKQITEVCEAYDNGQMLPRAIVAATQQARAAIAQCGGSNEPDCRREEDSEKARAWR